MTVRYITGIHCANGYNEGRGAIRVDLADDGSMIDADLRAGPDAALYCRQYGSDAPIITNGCWEFWPDDAELARLGIVPVQMITEHVS